MNRIYHSWDKWEDYRNGFYGGLEYPKENTLELCAELLKDSKEFDRALFYIVNEWKYACEHNLSNENMNRIAYLGQAACALKYKVPNSVSMGAFSLLSSKEQQEANAVAKKYLDLWLEKYEYTQKV